MNGVAKLLNLVGLVMAFIGTLLIWKTGFVYETLSAWTDQKMVDDVTKRNRERQFYQRIGFGLLSAGFLLQFIGGLAT